MEATKKVTGKSVKKWLGNNAIIVLMLDTGIRTREPLNLHRL